MGRKYPHTRPSQVRSSRKRYAKEMEKINDVTLADEKQFDAAQEKRERKNAHRLAHRQ